MEVLEVQSQRNLRKPNQNSLKLQLEVAWEPRLRPIAVSQAAADLAATVDDGKTPLKASHPDAVFGAEIPAGDAGHRTGAAIRVAAARDARRSPRSRANCGRSSPAGK